MINNLLFSLFVQFESRKRAQTTVDDSPVQLRHSRLTSSEEDDHDDGFSDIFDSDSNEVRRW